MNPAFHSFVSVFATLLSFLIPVAISAPLNVLRVGTTPDGFDGPSRGWNSYGIQANPATTPGWVYDQDHVTTQCDILSTKLSSGKYTYCSLDSGWSVSDVGDEYGRYTYDSSVFDLPSLADHLHSEGLQVGVYVLPGAFCVDGNKTIYGTDITLNSTFNGNNDGYLRCDFDFERDGVQQWHDSQINLFAEWGVDFIKLDFVTPGSPDNGGHLVPNNSGSVIAYHNAIKASGHQMRLDISWKLNRNDTYFDIWEDNADAMRTDQDINNGGASTFVAWATVQRAIEQYRNYSSARAAEGNVITIYPDMDNLFVGNPASTTGVNDTDRYTMMTHWIGAAANLITGSDLTHLDDLGVSLLTDPDALAIADFTAQYPMQPRNPGTGLGLSQQLQAWIAGPDASTGDAVVVLANYGPDQGQGGFGTSLEGHQTVTATWSDLGLDGTFDVVNVWTKEDLGQQSSHVNATLGEGASVLLKLTKT